MSPSPLDQALERSERALLRIERSIQSSAGGRGRDTHLRARVAEIVHELDDIIGAAGAHR